MICKFVSTSLKISGGGRAELLSIDDSRHVDEDGSRWRWLSGIHKTFRPLGSNGEASVSFAEDFGRRFGFSVAPSSPEGSEGSTGSVGGSCV